MFNKKKLPGYGFTLIELLIVVSILGILGGVTINVINISAQRNRASDGVKRATLEKLIQGIESKYAIEGTYPANSADTNLIPTYIKAWPNGTPVGATYTYTLDGGGANYGILVTLSSNASYCYKYRTDSCWGGGIRECSFCGTGTGCVTASCP